MNGRIANSAVKRCVIACSAASDRFGASRPRRATYSESGQTTQPARPSSRARLEFERLEPLLREATEAAGVEVGAGPRQVVGGLLDGPRVDQVLEGFGHGAGD
jgi:hypothetical protein